MGSENTIRTGTIVKKTHSGLSINSNSLSSLAPSSIYQFGIVVAINPTTKEIIYNAIEDNISVNKRGKALPLYKNKIQLPTTGSVVPLLRGPNTDISINGGEYSKTLYYLDPIGIWQTVEKNIIEKSAYEYTNPPENNVTNININNAEIGIPSNNPILEQTTVDTAQRPLPSPPPSVAVTSSPITPQPSPSVPAIPTPNYTFRISLNYETWEADVYNNNILIYTKKYVYVTNTLESIRANLTYEAKYFGFFINSQFYPPQPDIV
jgi:hypothetical protein